jgi:L-aspartate oxidase
MSHPIPSAPEGSGEFANDIVIVGGGLAGLFCALRLAPRPVTVLAAAPLGEGSSSAWAQGGLAAAVADGDSPEAHARDTIVAGAGIVDEATALSVCREAGERVRDLLAYGVPFDKDLEGRLTVSREAAHSARRIVHVHGDTAGAAIIQALDTAVRATPSIRVIEGFVAEELVMAGSHVSGIMARKTDDAGSQVLFLPARAVVLATGGIGHLYKVTTNPPESRGAGIALAARAGAVIADAEFVQFHPTAIDIGRDPAPLATEALRGDGAVLVNRAGERFMTKLHKDGELAPRDIVARGVFAEIAAVRGAYLDAREAIGAEFAAKFPTVYATCLSAGIDASKDLIPVAPAEHYHMGGVSVDEHGRTTLDGLWAAGEVASTGLHGANRLASNSLLEAVVFGARVAADVAVRVPARRGPAAAPKIRHEPCPPHEAAALSELRRLMSTDVGVIRDQAGLTRALSAILRIERESHCPNLRNMTVTALLVAASALARCESRGGHERTDFPASDPAQAHRTFMTLDDARAIALAATTRKRAAAAR